MIFLNLLTNSTLESSGRILNLLNNNDGIFNWNLKEAEMKLGEKMSSAKKKSSTAKRNREKPRVLHSS